MRISAKGEYAIRAMLDLCLQPALRVVPIQEIASRQDIPQRYLEQVLLALKRAGLLVSRRGAAGGYQLARPAEMVTVGQVLRAVEGGLAPFDGAARGGHARGGGSDELAELWEEIGRAVAQAVDRVTFGELVERAHARRRLAPAMYHI